MAVAIIGAGIAGLTAAVALERIGIRSTVYEQADRLAEVGAGLQLSPNAVRVLHRLGLAAHLAAVAVRPACVELRRWRDNRVIARTELGQACVSRYGFPYYALRRGALQRGLLTLVDPASLTLGRRLVGVDEDTDQVGLRFHDGSTAAGELVIGADGIRSQVRRALIADSARYGGLDVYRGLVPAGRLPAWETEPRIVVWLGPGQHCVGYPVGDGVSFTATVANGLTSDGPVPRHPLTESWTAPGTVDDLTAAYAGWPDEVLELLGAAGSVTRWALHERPTPPRWHSERLVLVGDAAHAMLPFGAQGAAQAIEDASCLASCLREAGHHDRGDGLARYQRARAPRIAEVAALVRRNARDLHTPDGRPAVDRDRDLAHDHRLENQAWLYGYDPDCLDGNVATASTVPSA